MSEKETTQKNNPDIITAPFTPEQVIALNSFQKEGLFHPFTCAGKIHEQSSPDLIAERNGWICPDNACDYTQYWAYSFMTARPLRQTLNRKLNISD